MIFLIWSNVVLGSFGRCWKRRLCWCGGSGCAIGYRTMGTVVLRWGMVCRERRIVWAIVVGREYYGHVGSMGLLLVGVFVVGGDGVVLDVC